MDQQGSQSAFSAPGTAITPRPLLGNELRPLSTGEVLDRTFALYRRHFWVFAAIGTLPAAVLTLSSSARLVLLALRHQPLIPQPVAGPDAMVRMMSAGFASQVYLLPGTLLFVVVYGMSHAATIAAVRRLTAEQTATAADAYREIRGRWKRWIGVTLWQAWSFLWPAAVGTLGIAGSLLFSSFAHLAGGAGFIALLALSWLLLVAALVLGVINFLLNALAMPAAVQEGLAVRSAIRRSRVLAAGRKGRIFLALLLVYALQTVLGGIQVPLVYVAVASHGAQQVMLQATQLLVQFVLTVLISPVASIALYQLYVDERVRREGYDIEVLMQRAFHLSPAHADRDAPQDQIA